MRNEILKTGQRLHYLMNQQKIKNAPALAEAMYKKGILKYSEKQKKEECHQYTGRTINIHLALETPEKLSGLWLKRYCDFFECSANFIMGYDSMPTPEISSVHDQTGLSETAIRKIISLPDSQRTLVSDLIDHRSFASLVSQITDLSEKECVSSTQSAVIIHQMSQKLSDQKESPSSQIDSKLVEKAMIYSISTKLTNMICDVTGTQL